MSGYQTNYYHNTYFRLNFFSRPSVSAYRDKMWLMPVVVSVCMALKYDEWSKNPSGNIYNNLGQRSRGRINKYGFSNRLFQRSLIEKDFFVYHLHAEKFLFWTWPKVKNVENYDGLSLFFFYGNERITIFDNLVVIPSHRFLFFSSVISSTRVVASRSLITSLKTTNVQRYIQIASDLLSLE